ncbi:MAG: peptide ABC transporter permease [Chloroflexi bacterium]|jgi:peptide/nickel transport system permease protein|nr:peptide ABC transporter permease [Chloroflexota bacterium]|tara:strand:- start:10792 stop:11733 length:942 start_codon:yes stop_codon:yes gene_type:complete
MLLYFLKRILLGVVIVVIAVSLLYAMIHLVPGDPVKTILGPRASPEIQAQIREKMGLNDPLALQIVKFLGNVATGDLGEDVFKRKSVNTIVFEQLPHTIFLVLAGIGWAVLIGIPLGCFAAVYQNSFMDRIVGVLSVSCIAIPTFLVAIYSVLLFAVTLKWLPAIGAGDGSLSSYIRHLILPAFAVGLGWVGYLARLVRASMLEIMGEAHVRTARAFGLKEQTVVFKYVLRLAVLPTITLIGMGIGILLSSAVFVEIVFARPGIGRLIFDAVTSRNYPVVMGSVLVTTVLFVVSTTLADLINAIVDPRLRTKD